MKLHELTPAPGSRRKRTRVGRGISAGQGKTSGRGQKGQFSRSSSNLPTGFEGGQMPLAQRLPKLRGFHNRFSKDFAVVNVGKLNRYERDSVVDEAALRSSGLARGGRDGVKVLAAGVLKVAVHVRVTAITRAARAAVEKAGGSVELLAAAPADTEPAIAEAAAGTEPAIAEAAAGTEPAIAEAAAGTEPAAGEAPAATEAGPAPDRESDHADGEDA